jgi:hypothetical protein
LLATHRCTEFFGHNQRISSEIHPKFIRNSSANVSMEQLWHESEVAKEER